MTKSWIITTTPQIGAILSMATSLGGEVTVVAVGDTGPIPGAASVVAVPLEENQPAEAVAPGVADLVTAADGDVVFVVNGLAERSIAGAVAARLGAPVLTSVVGIGGDSVDVTRYGGISAETVSRRGPVVVIADGGGEAEGEAPAPVATDAPSAHDVRVTDVTSSDTASVNLAAAPRIVAVGRGFEKREDLALARDLAARLGAEIAATKPLAETLEWFPHDSYVGVTGHRVAPELYIAVGISGQLQHTVGADGSKVIVVINSDEGAPYFAEADYGIVGDLHEVLPALTAAL